MGREAHDARGGHGPEGSRLVSDTKKLRMLLLLLLLLLMQLMQLMMLLLQVLSMRIC